MDKLIIMAGPCAIESREIAHQVAQKVKYLCEGYSTSDFEIEYIFKASWKKANRTRLSSFTGIDQQEALNILKEIGNTYDVPVITDIHESHEAALVATYVTHLQIPAFLCRQTDLLVAAGKTGLPVNVKKGQFVSPEMMGFAAEKIRSTGNDQVFLCERGTTFGYSNLIVDFTSIPRMQKFAPVIMDSTHCLQMPNQTHGVTGGDPTMIGTMVNAAIAAGVDGLFIETHPNPAEAGSDSATQLQLDRFEGILAQAIKIRRALNGSS
jgi:2-dehydro-3-deoxyphosphooctonate aldolase (KDO 8-P synthase)